MPWIYLFVAGLCEIVWAVAMKYSENFRRFGPTVVTVLFMILTYVLLARAMRSLPLGTAYAIWTGIGVVGAAIWGILFFGESRQPLRLVCIGLILAGIVGLRWLSAPSSD